MPVGLTIIGQLYGGEVYAREIPAGRVPVLVRRLVLYSLVRCLLVSSPLGGIAFGQHVYDNWLDIRCEIPFGNNILVGEIVVL